MPCYVTRMGNSTTVGNSTPHSQDSPKGDSRAQAYAVDRLLDAVPQDGLSPRDGGGPERPPSPRFVGEAVLSTLPAVPSGSETLPGIVPEGNSESDAERVPSSTVLTVRRYVPSEKLTDTTAQMSDMRRRSGSLLLTGSPESEIGDDSHIHWLVDTGDASELRSVLSMERPSPEQLRSGPYASMLYFAARAGHVEVMSVVFEWFGEGCLEWTGPLSGSYALHTAACRGHHKAVVWLLVRHGSVARAFDVRKLRNKYGETPLDVCTRQAKAHPDCLRVMEAFLSCESSLEKTFVPVTHVAAGASRSHDSKWARRMVMSSLIGDYNLLFDREDVSGEELCNGILREGSEFLSSFPSYSDWVVLRSEIPQEAGSNLWARHPTPEQIEARLKEAYLNGSEEELYNAAIQVFTLESFVSRSVNAALCSSSSDAEARFHLRPYVWLLHSAVRRLTETMPHRGPCYCSFSLSAELQGKYAPQQDERRNLISMEGLLLCTASAEKAVLRLQLLQHNTLLLIKPGNANDPRCCGAKISHISAYPNEEEVLFCPGQQLRLRRFEKLRVKELHERLGLPAPSHSKNHRVCFVELEAVDEFWSLAGDFFIDGSGADYEKQILQNRLEDDARIYGASSCEVAKSQDTMAKLLKTKGNLSEAEALFEHALKIRKRLLGDDHPDVAVSLGNIAELHRVQGKYADARPLYEEALRICRRQGPEHHVTLAATLTCLATLHRNQGEYSAAEPLLQEALGVQKQQLGDSHTEVAVILCSLAGLYREQRKYTAAEPLYEECLRIRKLQFGHDHPSVVSCLNDLAYLYRAMGNRAAAERVGQESSKIRRQGLDASQCTLNVAAGSRQAPSRGRCCLMM
eukprot:RCo029694